MNTLEKQFETFLRKRPTLGKGVYIAKGAVVMGDVTLGDNSSIWYNAVLRGDINRIVIGCRTNIQDNCVVHLADDFPCIIGDDVTVGHGAVVHACTVGNGTLIGIGAAILDGAVVGKQCLIGAHTLVTPGQRIPAGSLVLGSPAKVARRLTRGECSQLKGLALKYVRYAGYCLKHGINVSEPLAT